MIRRCDGTDPNLLMYINPKTKERVTGDEPAESGDVTAQAVPCDCGKVFDDTVLTVIYPHPRLL